MNTVTKLSHPFLFLAAQSKNDMHFFQSLGRPVVLGARSIVNTGASNTSPRFVLHFLTCMGANKANGYADVFVCIARWQ